MATTENPWNPCLDCGCHKNDSLVDKWNKRGRRVMLSPLITNIRSKLPPDIVARMPSDEVFGFGFDPWIADPFSDEIYGRMRAAIDTPTGRRYYCAIIPRPGGVPVVYEHELGIRHTVRADVPSKSDFRQIEVMTDDEFGAWLGRSLEALIAFVVLSCRDDDGE